MSGLQIDRYRNIGIMAHIDAGKTTCTERILFYTGRIHRTGEVHEGAATMDWMEQEQERGITITSAATTTFWTPTVGSFGGVRHRINIIDTPGHVDFTIEVERSLRVLDGAIAVFDAANGVESQSETVWRQADKHNVPRIAFLNKMDRQGADFAMSIESMRKRLGGGIVPIQLPLGEQEQHRGVIDLIGMRAVRFDDDSQGQRYEIVELTEAQRREAEKARVALIEACADVDDELLAHFLEAGPDAIGEAELERALRAGTIALRLVPVLCGSAYKNKGIQQLLDAVVAYLPSPLDIAATAGKHPETGAEEKRAHRVDAPVSALAFKSMNDRFVGSVTFLRIYSGRLEPGMTLLNTNRGKRERIGRLLLVHAEKREELDEAHAGLIVAAVGLRHTHTGDTLSAEQQPIVFESVELPEAAIERSIEPAEEGDLEKMREALQRLTFEDPSLRVMTNEEMGQVIMCGMGELHLEIAVDRLRREFGIATRTGEPRVAYRASISRPSAATCKYVRHSTTRGAFAHVELEIAAGERGSGFAFAVDSGATLTGELAAAVRRGVAAALRQGALGGYPVTDVAVRLVGGSYHEVESRPLAFEIAASIAFHEATLRGGLFLLEPIAAITVTTPQEFIGDVIADLNARRGQLRTTIARGTAQIVDALVPLSTMFGYVTDLRSVTHGRAISSMQFSHYAQVPKSVESDLLAATERGS